MKGTDNWLLHEHSLYEDLLSECRDAVENEDWEQVNLIFNQLVTHLKRHITLEEEVLYPAYESAPHAPQGPTTALRADHSAIIRLLQDMTPVIKTRNSEHMLECLAFLENRMITHHEKEEDIFLPMASYILNASHDELLRKLSEFDASKTKRKWAI
ncbi:MAG: hemerythrin domain-containing protein [Gammaproteobacteria bacterium]|jgi:hemerythrin-like domain-containing protein